MARGDIAIIGGGHNALVAATYLAQAGRQVTVLERLDHVGGAAVSEHPFEGVDARLSRYSYLVSLLPARIIRELRLDITLARRRHSSYTPLPGTDRGLLVDNGDAAATAASFATIGAPGDAENWYRFYEGTGRIAEALFPTVCEPLMARSDAERLVSDRALWSAIVENPIGEHLERSFENDLVRGVAFTDALIGTFAPAHDLSLAANRCFLYHVIGNGTGDWDVPIGGMGAVTSSLERAARRAGATIVTGAEVTSVTPDGEVRFRQRDVETATDAAIVLSCVAPSVLADLMGESTGSVPEGAQVKVNLLLRALPRLKDTTVDPDAAFGGTFHVNEGYEQLDTAYRAASAGGVPDPIPVELYCHSLTDPSILSPELAASGAHTLTAFALHTPDRLLARDPDQTMRATLERAVLDSIDSVLAEPIADLLMTDAGGRPTIETKTTRDLSDSLRLPGGNIFHGPLSWPFAEDDDDLSTPARRWGVATAHPRTLLCGSGARRGGGVSGIAGHNAAMAVLEMR